MTCCDRSVTDLFVLRNAIRILVLRFPLRRIEFLDAGCECLCGRIDAKAVLGRIGDRLVVVAAYRLHNAPASESCFFSKPNVAGSVFKKNRRTNPADLDGVLGARAMRKWRHSPILEEVADPPTT